MQEEHWTPSVVHYAREVITMHNTIIEQAAEIERLKDIEQKYDDLLNGSLKHSRVATANMMKILLTPGVVPAMLEDNKKKETWKTN